MVVAVLVGLLGLVLVAGCSSSSPTPGSSGLPTVPVSALPDQARAVLGLIEAGGPFPYPQDGVTFNNREGLLPEEPTGYYREYTVPTPGETDRGARRIVTGKNGERYWTDDHYASFSEIIGAGTSTGASTDQGAR